MKNTYTFAMTGLAVIALALLFPGENKAQIPPTQQLISENALLGGLAPGALFHSSIRRRAASGRRTSP